MSDQDLPEDEEQEPAPASDQAAAIHLERCLSCRHADQKNAEQGTLLCKKHNMLVNAPNDEIPDDCKEYEP